MQRLSQRTVTCQSSCSTSSANADLQARASKVSHGTKVAIVLDGGVQPVLHHWQLLANFISSCLGLVGVVQPLQKATTEVGLVAMGCTPIRGYTVLRT